MTMFNQQVGSLVTDGKRIVPTTATAVYAVTGRSRPILDSINLCNVSAGAVLVSVQWWKASDTVNLTIINATSIAVGSRLLLVDLPISMREGDEIRVTASVASSIDVIISVIESSGASQ